MTAEKDILKIANSLLNPTNIEVTDCKRLQSLWAGYGHILRLATRSTSSNSGQGAQYLILKYVTPPTGKSQDEGHLRKVISYQAEQYFYQHLAPQLPKDIAVATCYASINEIGQIALVLSDLSADFPCAGEKRGELSSKQVYGARNWLAKFHGFWWKRVGEIDRDQSRRPPLEESESKRDGVWLNGGYTYLATRRKEYASLQSDSESEWSAALCNPVHGGRESIAELVAQVLSSPGPYETLIHGDVKSENLFTSASGNEVAFFDFQYVGLGLGVCDLAKLFTCAVPMGLLVSSQVEEKCEMKDGERKLLRHYQLVIEKASGKQYPWEILEMHWKTALVDWLRFQASWGFWGNTEWLEARVRAILQDEEWRQWLLETTRKR